MNPKQLLKRLLYFPISPAVTRALFHETRKPAFSARMPRAILVIRLDEIGDMVLTSPFLRELRRSYPQARITLLVKPAIKNLVELCPYCDEVLTFDGRARWPIDPFIRHIRAYHLAKRKLRHRSFDWAIIPRWDVDFYHATLLAYFSRAPRRIAFSETVNPRKSVANKGYDTLLTDPVPCSIPSHEVSMTLGLLFHLGGKVVSSSPELWLSEEDRRFALDQVPEQSTGVTIAIVPGAAEKNRQWPVARYVALAVWAIQQFSARIVVLGGRADMPLGSRFTQGLPAASMLDLTGKTTLRQSAAVLSRCELFIGNDTGIKHIAAAMGVKVVEISRFPRNGDPLHPQSPFRFRAWGVESIVLQPGTALVPCGDDCMANEEHCIAGVDLQSVQHAVTACIDKGVHCRELKASVNPMQKNFSITL